MDKLGLTEMTCYSGNRITITRLSDDTFNVEMYPSYDEYSFECNEDIIIFLVNNLFTMQEVKEVKESLGIEYGME